MRFDAGSSSLRTGAGRSLRLGGGARALLVALAVLTLTMVLGVPGATAAKAPIYDIGTFASGTASESFNAPRGVAVNNTGNGGVPPGTIYVADSANNRIQSFDANGSFLRAWGWDTTGVVNERQLVHRHGATGGFYTLALGDEITGGTGTGEVSAGSNVVSNVVTSAGQFNVGHTVNIPGFSATSTITAVNEAAGTLTISTNAAASGNQVLKSGIRANALCNNATDGVRKHVAALPSIGSQDNVGCAGNRELIFQGALAFTDIPELICDGSNLTGGLEPGTCTVTTVVHGFPTGGTDFEICEFDGGCQAGSAGSAPGQFANGGARGVAVNQTSGDVYVFDPLNQRVQRFDATGHFVDSWGSSGSGAGMFATTTAAPGIATDSSGNVYVADPGNRRVQKFNSAGAFQRMAGWDVVESGPGDDTSAPEDEFEVCVPADGDVCKAGAGSGAGDGRFSTDSPGSLAVSPSGDVYAVDGASGKVIRLDSALALIDPEFAPTVVAGGGEIRAVAVKAPGGTVFLSKATDANIYEIDPVSEEKVAEHPAGATNWVGLALNESSGRLYASSGNTAAGSQGHVVRILDEGNFPQAAISPASSITGLRATLNGTVDPNGVELTSCSFRFGVTTTSTVTVPCEETPAEIGAGTDPVPVHADVSGLAPNGTRYSFRLLASGPDGSVVSRSQVFKTPDTVVTGGVSALTGTTATLEGSVNPAGEGLTECLFEYGTTTTYGETAPCDPDAAGIGDGSNFVAVAADVSGLDPVTTYHFRLKATYDGAGTTFGADRTFTTLGPWIGATWSEDVAVNEALLKAEIDPEGKPTTYHFEYGPTTAYGSQTPELEVGSDSAGHVVSRFLQGLQPATTYHYRVVATNPDGINEGPDNTFVTLSRHAGEVNCANQSFRIGAAANLPDCRAYEMVSPIDKNGGDIETATEDVGDGSRFGTAYRQASLDGERITYSSATAFGDAVGGHFSNQYLSTRSAQGWSTHAISSRRGKTLLEPTPVLGGNFRWFTRSFFQGFTPDLTSAWIRDDNVTPLTPGALDGYVNLYRRDNAADAYEPLTVEDPFGPNVRIDLGRTIFAGGVRFLGASTDLRHQIFAANAPLTPEAPEILDPERAPSQLYDFVDGELHLVSILPDGKPAAAALVTLPTGEVVALNSFAGTIGHGILLSTQWHMVKNAVSEDGSRIVWSTTASLDGSGPMYVRENPDAAVSRGTGSGDIAAGSADVTNVTTSSGSFQVGWRISGSGIPAGTTIAAVEPGSLTLSAAATATAAATSLSADDECTQPAKACTVPVSEEAAQFWAASADGSRILFSKGAHPSRTLHLFDVDSRTTDQIAAESVGVAATAEDLSDIYFVSREAHDGGIAGQNNLYHYHDGSYTLVGAVTEDDLRSRGQIEGGTQIESANIVGLNTSNRPSPIFNQTRVTPDGLRFAFMSNSSELSEAAAGYDNTDVVTGKADFQVYHYDAATGKLSCVSCNPSGARPRGTFLRHPYNPNDQALTNFPDLRAAASIPTHEHDLHASRLLSDDGRRLYFHTSEALLPRDTNGAQDVYQWEAPGSGSCDSGDADFFAASNGCVSLISSGRDGAKSEFIDADPSGSEVFFATDESLDPRDPGLRDVYVAKVGGGFPLPTVTAPCEGEACQSPPPPPVDPTPASASFQGPGDPRHGKAKRRRCPKGKRQLKPRRGKTRCVAKRKAKRAKRANHNRRTAR